MAGRLRVRRASWTTARAIELAVAPDITVELRPKGKKRREPGDTLSAGTAARSPRFKNADRGAARRADVASGGPRGSPAAGAAAKRRRRRRSRAHAAPPSLPPTSSSACGARLAAARPLRSSRSASAAAALAKSLEAERTRPTASCAPSSVRLRAELERGRDRPRREPAPWRPSSTRRAGELREVQRAHETRRRAHAPPRAGDAGAVAPPERGRPRRTPPLCRRAAWQTGALESTREALARPRGREAAGCATALTRGPGGAGRARRDPRRARPPAGRRRAARIAPGVARGGAASRALATPIASETQRFDVLGLGDERDDRHALAAPRATPAPRRSGHESPDDSGRPRRRRPSACARSTRPCATARVVGRLLALIVLCGVIAAVWVVLHSTVLH